MGRIKNSMLTGLALLTFLGCEQRPFKVRGTSPILYEDAVVREAVYSPSRHGSGSGGGPTIDFDGNIGFAFTSVSVNVPEKYAVVFECQHGKFIVEGTDDAHKSLWKRMSEGDTVRVSYKEIYESVCADTNKDGAIDTLSRALIDYDFLDANKK
ncbi:MAG: hypothetical protein AABW50_01195 [Nanoarchaeota archaeon]